MTNKQQWVTSLVSHARFGQFLSVGVLGAIVDNLVLAGLVELAAVTPLWAKVASAEAAVILMFALNEHWTFSEFSTENPLSVIRRFVRSNVVRAGGVMVALSVLAVLHGFLGVWYLAANITGIGVGFAVNYVAESLFTWQTQSGTHTKPD